MTQIPRILLSGFFLLGVFVPALDLAFGFLPRRESTEKRGLAEPPRPDATPLLEIPRAMDAWISDHFGFRNQLVRAWNRFQVTLLRSSPDPDAIVGSDGWLFYASYGDGADIRDFLGRIPLSQDELAARVASIEERRAALAARGITYLFTVAPNKETIYPERVPLVRTPQHVTRLDQLVRVLRGQPQLAFLDLRPVLAAERARRDVYFVTDSHWNWVGSWAAFRAILAQLAEMRSGVPPMPEHAVRFAAQPASGGDVAALLGLGEDLPDVTQEWEWVGDPPYSPLRVVVLGDSFAEYIQPYFEGVFEYVNPMKEVVRGGFELDAILAQDPDVVIEQHAERYLVEW
jgi:hypothetical protein